MSQFEELKARLRAPTQEFRDLHREAASAIESLEAEIAALNSSDNKIITDLSEYISSLETQLAEIKGGLTYRNSLVGRLEAELDESKQQLAEYKKAAERLSESVAKAVYMQWRDSSGYVPWVVGGNSLMQDSARRIANTAINAAMKGEQSSENS